MGSEFSAYKAGIALLLPFHFCVIEVCVNDTDFFSDIHKKAYEIQV